MNTVEIWKPIPSLPGYEASSTGRVRGAEGLKAQYPLSSKSPYRRLCISKRYYLAHRLVAEAFFGPSPLEVNHKDGVRWNNCPSNLEYVKHSANVQHAYDTGLNNAVRLASSRAMVRAHAEGRVRRPKGEERYNAKLTEASVRAVKEAFLGGQSDSSLGRRFGVARETIRQIRQGRTWRHV